MRKTNGAGAKQDADSRDFAVSEIRALRQERSHPVERCQQYGGHPGEQGLPRSRPKTDLRIECSWKDEQDTNDAQHEMQYGYHGEEGHRSHASLPAYVSE